MIRKEIGNFTQIRYGSTSYLIVHDGKYTKKGPRWEGMMLVLYRTQGEKTE